MNRRIFMNLKRIPSFAALAMAALAIMPVGADPSAGGKGAPDRKPALRIRIIQPKPGATWYFGAKQVAEWTVSGLPPGNHAIVAYLENVRDGKKGYIFRDSVGNGRAQANYVVNEIGFGEEAFPLENGKYVFSLALYRPTDSAPAGPGERLLEKRGGIIRIKGSDVGMRPERGPIPDDQPAR